MSLLEKAGASARTDEFSEVVEKSAKASDEVHESVEPRIKLNPPKSSALSILIYFSVLMFGVYGGLTFAAPSAVIAIQNNLIGSAGLLSLAGLFFWSLVRIIEGISNTSFVEIDRKARRGIDVATKRLSDSALGALSGNNYISGILKIFADVGEKSTAPQGNSKTERALPQPATSTEASPKRAVLGSAFEIYICSVVDGLERHVSITEEKGSNLLDRGLLFLFGGMLFYISAIIIWQLWAKYGEPKDHVMYIGMAACSVVFLVCEFLAAWFLKQYRHYVDASLACMRVKSVYDRYLLSYYAVKEFDQDQGELSKGLVSVLEALKEDVKWPAHKENTNNDFNYIAEAVSAVDKLKSMLQPSAKKSSTDEKPA